jgi:uncharacterized protein (DUF1501 family)
MKSSSRKNVRGLPSLSRRDFMKFSGGCAGLLSTSLLSSIINLKMTNSALAAAGDTTGYKALVCVFLLGGNDSWNMLTPYEDTEYNHYKAIRGSLALDKAALLPIRDSLSGRQFGIHPRMPEIRDLYTMGNSPLAFVANVGSLVQPTTKSSGKRPVNLFSHIDEQRHWQSSVPQDMAQKTGWAGRMADILTDTVNRNPIVSMNIALDSVNLLQTGGSVRPYVVGPEGAVRITAYNENSAPNRIFKGITDELQTNAYANLFEATYGQVHRDAIDVGLAYSRATSGVALGTSFPNTLIGRQLRQVALAVGARQSLGHGRQIFFVPWGGWDHHDNLLSSHAAMLPQLSQALAAFYKATVDLGVDHEVVTFTASDFGRTLSSNGDGSDHGWGGNQIVMGSSVFGGRLYGKYPDTLRANSDLDVGRGRLIPTTSVDEYNAELALWFGVQNDDQLKTILPNIRNFYSSGASTAPLGFML